MNTTDTETTISTFTAIKRAIIYSRVSTDEQAKAALASITKLKSPWPMLLLRVCKWSLIHSERTIPAKLWTVPN